MKLLALLPLVALAQASELYIGRDASASRASLSAPEVNAVLSHHLGVSEYEVLPKGIDTQLFEYGSFSKATLKLVVVMECGADSCAGVVPEAVSRSSYTLPSLPDESWTSVVALHVHRLKQSLGLTSVHGLEDVIVKIKSVPGWLRWVGEDLGHAIGFKPLSNPAEEDLPRTKTVSEFDILSEKAAKALASDVAKIEAAIAAIDAGQRVFVLQLDSLRVLAQEHGLDSAEYNKSAEIISTALNGLVSLVKQSAQNLARTEPDTLVLALSPYRAPLFKKKSEFLSHFYAGLSKRAVEQHARSIHMMHAKREFSAPAKRATKNATVIVPSSATCFASLDILNNQTASCLGHGVGVRGITTRGSECWVCSCKSTVDARGKVIYWAGEGCEKQDVSSQFTLLFFSSVGLIAVALFSVALLYQAGTETLPATLASLSGGNGHAKSD